MDFRNRSFCCKSDFIFFTYIILLSTILTFYIRSSDLNHHTAQSLCPFASLCLFPLLSHPQPLETTFLLCVSMSLTSFSFRILHISAIMWFLSFSICFIGISLSIRPSRFIIVADDRISFFKAD